MVVLNKGNRMEKSKILNEILGHLIRALETEEKHNVLGPDLGERLENLVDDIEADEEIAFVSETLGLES